jgi:23S rRNA (uracil1939-C5)-methyltransferase
MSEPLRIGDSVELEIEKIVFGGEGFGRCDGRAIFVPFSAPGDRVRAAITRVESSWARARLESLVVASPARRPAPCAHFGVCGGCQLQHLEHAAQLDAKRAFVIEALKRIGKIEFPGEIGIRSARELGYRSRAELQIARDESGAAKLGYFAAGSHEVGLVEQCPILAPELERELGRVNTGAVHVPPNAARVHMAAGDRGAKLVFTDETDVALSPVRENVDDDASRSSRERIEQRVAGFDFRFDARSFFQANRSLIDELVKVAVGERNGSIAIDLYAGAGLFSLPLARRFASVTAVEGDEAASALCAENAHANGVTNVRCEARAVEEWLALAAKNGAAPGSAVRMRPDLVLLDPPRSGAGRGVLEGIVHLEPAAIAYVSCDPATLARDLRRLVDRGFRIESIEALDMFPQTYHVETVAQLVRDS